jgi:hypothetical protein
MGTEITALAAASAAVVIEPEKRLGMMISSREKQERNQGRCQCRSFQMNHSNRRWVEGAHMAPATQRPVMCMGAAAGISAADN